MGFAEGMEVGEEGVDEGGGGCAAEEEGCFGVFDGEGEALGVGAGGASGFGFAVGGEREVSWKEKGGKGEMAHISRNIVRRGGEVSITRMWIAGRSLEDGILWCSVIVIVILSIITWELRIRIRSNFHPFLPMECT